MSSVLAPAIHRPETSPAVPRLLVTRQDPETRVYAAVGVLSCAGSRFTFSYLPTTAARLPGFSDLGRTYSSATLFPLFSQRVMDPRRPDHPQWLRWLGLEGDPDVFEVLAHSGGRRVSDSIELIRIPEPDADGGFALTFLVHGVRHRRAEDADFDRRLEQLAPGTALGLRQELDNAHDHRALLVTDADHALGWVPQPLLALVGACREAGNLSLSVLQANGPGAGDHLRLLVRAEGRLPLAASMTDLLLPAT